MIYKVKKRKPIWTSVIPVFSLKEINHLAQWSNSPHKVLGSVSILLLQKNRSSVTRLFALIKQCLSKWEPRTLGFAAWLVQESVPKLLPPCDNCVKVQARCYILPLFVTTTSSKNLKKTWNVLKSVITLHQKSEMISLFDILIQRKYKGFILSALERLLYQSPPWLNNRRANHKINKRIKINNKYNN